MRVIRQKKRGFFKMSGVRESTSIDAQARFEQADDEEK